MLFGIIFFLSDMSKRSLSLSLSLHIRHDAFPPSYFMCSVPLKVAIAMWGKNRKVLMMMK